MPTVDLQQPHLDHSLLTVQHNGITFENIGTDLVHIAVTVHNEGAGASDWTTAELWAAPLGAFVPWRPLALLQVPALEPGHSAVLDWWALTPRPRTLGTPDRVPPRKVLTALGADDQPPSRGQASKAEKKPGRSTVLAQAFPTTTLPEDLMQLLGRPNVHWAGNLNVFIGDKPVERHLARALRIYPGRTNVAYFVLGQGSDAYAFELTGAGADWNARLYDMTECNTLVLDQRRDAPLEPKKWLEVPGMRMLLLALEPPTDCREGTVEVHVEQRSTGQTAVVEFSFDPRAAGPGCYVV